MPRLHKTLYTWVNDSAKRGCILIGGTAVKPRQYIHTHTQIQKPGKSGRSYDRWEEMLSGRVRPSSCSAEVLQDGRGGIGPSREKVDQARYLPEGEKIVET